jgi:hypothetical protein
MKHFKASRAAPFHRLTPKQIIIFIALFALAIAGGPVLTFLMARYAPGTEPGPYAFLFQLTCLLCGLLLLRSAHAVRSRYIALFITITGTALAVGWLGLGA